MVVLGLGFGHGGGDEGGEARHDEEVVWGAAVGGEAGFQVGVVGTGGFDVLGDGVDDLGVLGGDLEALFAGAGLDQDGAALGGAGDAEGALDLEVGAFVVERVELRGVEELAGVLVAGQGAGFPGVPEAFDDFHELGGAGVAGGVVEVGVAVEVAGLGVGPGGDDVPAGSAAADVVQRGPFAGDVERLVVGGGGGGDEADMGGDGGEGGEEG